MIVPKLAEPYSLIGLFGMMATPGSPLIRYYSGDGTVKRTGILQSVTREDGSGTKFIVGVSTSTGILNIFHRCP